MIRSVVRATVLAYIAYLALALLVITPALNLLPHHYLRDTYGRELHTGWVLFNPFTLSLDINEAQLRDATGEPFMGFSKASVDLSLASLWQTGWVFDAVTIRDVDLALTRLPDGKFNISDLLAIDAAAEPPASDDAPLPGLTIHNLELHAATIIITDQTRKKPFSSRWNGLHIQATDLSTVAEEGRPFTVNVESQEGGMLQWEGKVSLPLGNSAGRVSLSNLNLRHVWLFAQQWLPFELKEGQLTVAGEYEFNWHDGFSYRLNGGHVALSAIDIVPKKPEKLPDTSVALHTLDIDNIALDSATQQVTMNTVALDGLALAGWMDDAQISLQELLVPAQPAGAADKKSDDAPWSAVIDKVQLSNSSLRWRSPFTEPQSLDIKPVEATLEHITWPLSGDTRLSLRLTANEQAHLAVNGTLALADGNGSLDYTLEGLPLTWFSPQLPKALKITITEGKVDVQGQVALQDYAPMTVALGGKIRDFAARQQHTETALTGWDSVRIDGLAVDMQQHTLELQKLTIDSYTGRLHIQEDGSINASNLWKEEVGEQAQQIADDLTADKPWSFSIPTIVISDSTIDFMDQSLPIPFRTVIGDIEGEVRNISSNTGSAATVELAGSVDGYAPVALTGEIDPFATPADLDLKLTFNGVDMALLSPYSRVYAGYVIEQGLLNLDLRYTLKSNRLQGHNSIRIEKLKLGEKISSAKAVDIPLKIALAMLTDANGVIDMAIPVSGDVNSPDFELGSVISKAFFNLITKVVTAPFNLLASLVNSEEDLQRLTFAAGSTQLNDANKEKLTQLAGALVQRPQLSMVITGRLNLATDQERLQRNILKAQLLDTGLSAEEIKARGPDWEEAITKLYENLPSSSPATTTTAREQYAKVVQSIAVPAAQMTGLAEQRAVAVKTYLLNEAGLAPDRAVVAQANADAPENTFSGVELGMGN